MTRNVCVTVDFREEPAQDKRMTFFASLAADDWKKCPEPENRWTATFKEGATAEAAMNVVRHDIDRAAKKAGILSYEAQIRLDDGPQVSFVGMT